MNLEDKATGEQKYFIRQRLSKTLTNMEKNRVQMKKKVQREKQLS